MRRSKNQLMGAYAPGRTFSFEGGQGSFISGASSCPHYDLNPIKQRQIEYRLFDSLQFWWTRGNQVEQMGGIPTSAEQILDPSLVSGINPVRIEDLKSRFVYVQPESVNAFLFPLTFSCSSCGLFLDFKKPSEAVQKLAQHNHCPHCNRPAHWRQIDVVEVHPSGGIYPISPGRNQWSPERRRVMRDSGRRCQTCHNDTFLLDDRKSRFSDWVFQCTHCGSTKPLIENDENTLRSLGEEVFQHQRLARCQANPANASSTHYTLSDQFVVMGGAKIGEDPYRTQEILDRMDRNNPESMGDFIAETYGLGKGRVDDEVLLEMAEKDDRNDLKKELQRLQTIREKLGEEFIKEGEYDEARQAIFRECPSAKALMTDLPDSLASLIENRDEFTARFDPFLLAVEHDSLVRDVIGRGEKVGGRNVFVPFDQLDEDIAPAEDEARRAQEIDARQCMNELGIRKAGLIRNFQVCRFSYGYTRQEPTPVANAAQTQIPVRMNLFPRIRLNQGGSRQGGHPIYVIDQTNEAYYFQLDPETVYAWLKHFEVPLHDIDRLEWSPENDRSLGGHILERALPFGRFFQNINPNDHHKVYPMVYRLLHSFSHLIMRQISENSGLNIGSLGEYLFPADLAFVVYRNGTTMDLGDLSSLWRYRGNGLFRHMMEPRNTACSAGSLCDERGGACPDCLMIPETVCIANNEMLARAVFAGGRHPYPSMNHCIRGYFQISGERNSSQS